MLESSYFHADPAEESMRKKMENLRCNAIFTVFPLPA